MVLIELRTQGCATFARLTSLHPGLIYDHPFGVFYRPKTSVIGLKNEFDIEDDIGNAQSSNTRQAPCSWLARFEIARLGRKGEAFWPSAKTGFERGLKGAFVTQQFEPSNAGVFEEILAGTMRSAQLQTA